MANVPGADASLSTLLPYSTQGATLPRRPSRYHDFQIQTKCINVLGSIRKAHQMPQEAQDPQEHFSIIIYNFSPSFLFHKIQNTTNDVKV